MLNPGVFRVKGEGDWDGRGFPLSLQQEKGGGWYFLLLFLRRAAASQGRGLPPAERSLLCSSPVPALGSCSGEEALRGVGFYSP